LIQLGVLPAGHIAHKDGAEAMLVIGLMSGTSLDGVDAALIETDGETVQRFGPSVTVPYEPELRARLRELIETVGKAGGRATLPPDPSSLLGIEAELTLAHIDAVRALGVRAELIGFHGQTVLHAPQRRYTRQIGDSKRLAEATQTQVACDFRLADVAAGGQGAPLAPLFHAALAAAHPKPLLLINIGGVSNLTWIGPGAEDIVACDTGPGNALLDDFMAARTGRPIDPDGRCALAGQANLPILKTWLNDPFFALPAPKSLDRQHFAYAMNAVDSLSTEDGAATLAHFTALAIATTPLPSPPLCAYVTGGGRKNAAIMAALSAALAVPVLPVEAAGWDGDALEAQCFAFLAVRVLQGLPLSLPKTTGVASPMPGGRIVTP
jgi:anhydro-N-acetylmuramic acid kinase